MQSIWTPPAFQGWGKTRNYFEGWYFKLVDAEGAHPMAFIPGIAWDEQGKGEAFLQVLDGTSTETTYIRYPVEDFRPEFGAFQLQLGDHRFGQHSLNLNGDGWTGSIRFSEQFLWPVRWNSPGIMGWYAFVPAMECYHGIVAFDGGMQGQLEFQGKTYDFSGGRAYLEKDWGSSFPSSWLWMQSNSFERAGISIKTSVARIPWMTGAFVGFIGGLLVDGELYRFTTYTGARLKRAAVSDSEVIVEIEDRRRRLKIVSERAGAGELIAPVAGLMEARVQESLSANIHVRLEERSGGLIYEGTGKYGGLEVGGNYKELLTGTESSDAQ
jgi:hypothetical protein